MGITTGWAKGSTELSVSNDAVGSAYINMWDDSGELYTMSSSTASGGSIYSGQIKLTGYHYANKIEHYAYRRVSGRVEDWRCTYY